MESQGNVVIELARDPRVSQDLVGGVTLRRLDFDAFEEEVFSEAGEVFGKGPLWVEEFDLIGLGVIGLTVERVLAISTYHVEYHGTAPDVNCLGIDLGVELFRSHVDECTALLPEE